ncbi:MAG: VanW family protein, partial [Actinomycetota bacterium]
DTEDTTDDATADDTAEGSADGRVADADPAGATADADGSPTGGDGDDAGDKGDADTTATPPVPAVVRDPNEAAEPDEPTTVMPAVAGVEPVSPPVAPRRTGRRLVLASVGTAVVLYLLLAAAWAVDSATHRDRAMRGVHLDDIDVGGEDRDGMDDAIATLTERLADTELEVSVGSTTVSTDPVTLGAAPDGDSMIDEALEARRGGFLPVRPLTWAAGLFSRHTVPARYLVEPVTARRGVDAVIDPALDEPVEPGLEFDGRSMVLVPGSSGVAVDAEAVIDALPATIEDGEPFRLEVEELEAAPTFSDDDLSSLADELNEATAEPINVRVLDQLVALSPNSQRSWIRLDTSDGEAAWTIDEEAALDELQPLFPALGSEDQQARFEVVDGEPIIIPAAETVVCCEEGAGEALAETIAAPIPVPADDADEDEPDATDGEETEPTLRLAQLRPKVTGFDEGVAELETLGIDELVSTFTTEHACCENRVKNIQRFADLTQGTIIRPGEEFSLNGAVGRRTRDNGFFAAGAIAQGNFEDQVGGGISQYATTFFNAAFFAGIEFLEYQSHSIYISRYPRGREATISWPRPDLKVLNNTPYGILVWNEYTPTSITVSFYSTEHLEVEALDRRRSSDRQCRIDITPRQITFPDGTVEEDTVRAIYRPGEGLDCNGNSTRPEEDEPPPTPEPEPEPEPPPPDPEPDPDPDPGDDGGDDDDVLPPDG